MSVSHKTVLVCVALLVVTHNAEEAMTFRHFGMLLAGSLAPMYIALLVATLVPSLIVVWALMQPRNPRRLWWVLLILAVLLLNVLWHVAVAVALRGYSPGLVSALTINSPVGLYVFRRAVRERWVSSKAFYLLVPCAFVVHGPILLGLLILTGVMSW